MSHRHAQKLKTSLTGVPGDFSSEILYAIKLIKLTFTTLNISIYILLENKKCTFCIRLLLHTPIVRVTSWIIYVCREVN